jgi:hypothetical protein
LVLGRLIPVDHWPKGCEREITPASERPSRHPVITDFKVFE